MGILFGHFSKKLQLANIEFLCHLNELNHKFPFPNVNFCETSPAYSCPCVCSVVHVHVALCVCVLLQDSILKITLSFFIGITSFIIFLTILDIIVIITSIVSTSFICHTLRRSYILAKVSILLQFPSIFLH